jgi:hypothetical protein
LEEKPNQEVSSKPKPNPTIKNPFEESSSIIIEPQLQPEIRLPEQNPFSSVGLRNNEVQQDTGMSFYREDSVIAEQPSFQSVRLDPVDESAGLRAPRSYRRKEKGETVRSIQVK